MNQQNSGATQERKDVPQQKPDTCPMHPAGGRHYWHWMPGMLLQRLRCGTCYEERPFKRWGGQ